MNNWKGWEGRKMASRCTNEAHHALKSLAIEKLNSNPQVISLVPNTIVLLLALEKPTNSSHNSLVMLNCFY